MKYKVVLLFITPVRQFGFDTLRATMLSRLNAALLMSTISTAQVQLLVSNSDVENYKQIKSDLDELRLLVEKSELWVYKSKKDLPTESRVRKITPGLVGLRMEGGSSSKEPEQRKDSLEQQDLEVVSLNTAQVRNE